MVMMKTKKINSEAKIAQLYTSAILLFRFTRSTAFFSFIAFLLHPHHIQTTFANERFIVINNQVSSDSTTNANFRQTQHPLQQLIFHFQL